MNQTVQKKSIQDYRDLDIIQALKYLYEIKFSLIFWVLIGLVSGVIYTSVNVYKESVVKLTPETGWNINLINPDKTLNNYSSLITNSNLIQNFIDEKHKHLDYHNIHIGPSVKVEFDPGLLSFQMHLLSDNKIDEIFLKTLLEKINNQADVRNMNLFRNTIIFNSLGEKLIENNSLDLNKEYAYIEKLVKLQYELSADLIASTNELLGHYHLKNNKQYILTLENFCKPPLPQTCATPAQQFDITMNFLLKNDIIDKKKYGEHYLESFENATLFANVNTAITTLSNLYTPKFDVNKIEIDTLNKTQNQRKPQIIVACVFLGFIFAIIFNFMVFTCKALYHTCKTKIDS